MNRGTDAIEAVAGGLGGVQFVGAYALYGENYAETGTQDREFGGMEQDIVSSGSYPLYDALMREYHPTWGRWLSPDPAGLAAANPANPQSWNRYAYVVNNPLIFTDPSGLYTWQAGNCVYNTVAVCVDGVFQGYDTILLFCYSGYGGGPPPSGGMGGAGASGSGSGSGGGAGHVPSLGKLTKQVNQCAAKYGQQHSLASELDLGNSKLAGIFLGNDASAVSNLIFGPNRASAAGGLAGSQFAAAAGRVVSALPNPFGTPTTTVTATAFSVSGETAQATAISVEVEQTLPTVGESVLGKFIGKVFNALTWIKAPYDAATYINGLASCSGLAHF